jgi:hypothetical protein
MMTMQWVKQPVGANQPLLFIVLESIALFCARFTLKGFCFRFNRLSILYI